MIGFHSVADVLELATTDWSALAEEPHPPTQCCIRVNFRIPYRPNFPLPEVMFPRVAAEDAMNIFFQKPASFPKDMYSLT